MEDFFRRSFFVRTFALSNPTKMLLVEVSGSGVDIREMNSIILKVIKSGDMFSVKSEKSETGQLNKRNLVLKELGGKFENEYAVAVLGDAASMVLNEGDLVAVALRFQTREYNGQVFQDITVTDIYPLKK